MKLLMHQFCSLTAPLLLVLCVLWSSPSQAQQEIVIGTVGGQLGLDNSTTYQPFSSWLDQNIPDYRFRVEPFASIETLITAAESQELDFAMLTPVAFVELDASLDEVRTIATVTQQLDGQVYPWLAGAVFSLADQPELETLADVRGKRVIALSPLALGGWLAAVREWRQLGLDETRDFASVDFVFSYEQVLAQVCSGAMDVGVLAAGIFNQRRNSCERPLQVLTLPGLVADPRYPAALSTRLYPEVAFVAIGEQHDETLVRAVAQALMAITPGSDIALAATVAGFTPPLSYNPVEELMQELRVGPYENYGEVTFMAFLRQHSLKVFACMLLFLGALGLAFGRTLRLNRKLQQAEQFRKLLFEKSNLPVAVLDRKTLCFVDLNPAALAIYGFRQREELIGSTPMKVSAPVQKNGEPAHTQFKLVDALLESGRPHVFEWIHLRPDGSSWEAEIHLLPLSFGGSDLIQATMVDVSERNRIRADRERMEQQLHHAQRLESLGRLSGAIAHDFNNLLTVINGYSELMLLSMDKQSADYRTLLEIAQAGWRARDLTNQLLTFGRRHVATVRPINVNVLILDAGNMFRSLLGEKIQLQTSLGTSIGMTLADPGQFNQVLMNMLVNAKDAMPDGGKCYITTGSKHLQEAEAGSLGVKAGDYVVIAVTDTGMGMSPETREHVFEPFYSTKGDKGTGIGLATAYGIIRQGGGAVTFQSEMDVGTTFTIYLPVTTQTDREERVNETAEKDLKASGVNTVLVVEDQPDVRVYASTVLRSAGYRVLEADSGDRALEVARAHQGRIDLLFTDVVMPGMNGRELAEYFQDTWPSVHILFTSGYADDEVALHGVVQEKIMFIAKPYIPHLLLSKVKILLG